MANKSNKSRPVVKNRPKAKPEPQRGLDKEDLDRVLQDFYETARDEDIQRVKAVYRKRGLTEAVEAVRSIERVRETLSPGADQWPYRPGPPQPFWEDYEGERDSRGLPINLEEQESRRQGQTPPPTPTVSGTRQPASRTHRKGGVVKRKSREFAKGGAYRGKPHAYAAGGRVTDASASRRRSQRKK
jgi:hypothetical protein